MLVKLPVDPWSDRCRTALWVRAEVADGLRQVLAEVWGRGGVVTTSGSLRQPGARLNRVRSPVSLHYLGRAIDLCLWSGMQGLDDPYAVLRDGPDVENPRWRVLCACDADQGEADASGALRWQRGPGVVAFPREGAFFDLTALFARCSWQPIAARPGWRADYAATEWWHFACHDGLVPGETTFGAELTGIFPPHDIAGTPLTTVIDYVWDGRGFVDPVRYDKPPPEPG